MAQNIDPFFEPNIAAYNDAIADIYDEATASDWRVNQELIPAALAHFGLFMAVDVHLDLGAGTGQTIVAVKQAVAASRTVGVDTSPRMLACLQEKLPEVEPVHSTIEDYLRNVEDDFTIITAIGSLEFVRDLPHTLGQAALRLQTNGLLIATYIEQEGSETERTFQVPSLGQAFTEYYWPHHDIEESLTAGGLVLEGRQRVVAYTRDEETITYNAVVASRPDDGIDYF